MCPSEIVRKDYGGRLSDRLPVAPSIIGLLLVNDSSMARAIETMRSSQFTHSWIRLDARRPRRHRALTLLEVDHDDISGQQSGTKRSACGHATRVRRRVPRLLRIASGRRICSTRFDANGDGYGQVDDALISDRTRRFTQRASLGVLKGRYRGTEGSLEPSEAGRPCGLSSSGLFLGPFADD